MLLEDIYGARGECKTSSRIGLRCEGRAVNLQVVRRRRYMKHDHCSNTGDLQTECFYNNILPPQKSRIILHTQELENAPHRIKKYHPCPKKQSFTRKNSATPSTGRHRYRLTDSGGDNADSQGWNEKKRRQQVDEISFDRQQGGQRIFPKVEWTQNTVVNRRDNFQGWRIQRGKQDSRGN